MMHGNLEYAEVPTPTPSKGWVNSSDIERLVQVEDTITCNTAFVNRLDVVTAKSDGQILVRLKGRPSAGERGTLLLDLEEYIKAEIDSGLVVWVEALEDKSSLRKLRGIEVKS